MTELNVLVTAAISIAVIHTLIGIDHYIPFVALSKANGWTMKKTAVVVLICGIGHVLSSVLLGLVGIGLSQAVSVLVDIESFRGMLATYFLIAFGLVYMAYGIRLAMKNKTHKHTTHEGNVVSHTHFKSGSEHEHKKADSNKSGGALWGLFILFVLGPCEPLIPILMYPAATQNTFALLLVTLCFAFFTILTMLVMTVVGLKGVKLLKINKLERYRHARAGFAVFLCGVAVLTLPI
jgi:sulfite exporter TauE/SafE